jgi:hypothetical protein
MLPGDSVPLKRIGALFEPVVSKSKVCPATNVVAGTFVDQEFVSQNQFVAQFAVMPVSQVFPPAPPRQTSRASEKAGGGRGAMPHCR